MAVRIGVDVGGTFTKAVACDAVSGRVLVRSVVPTTQTCDTGVAEGVVAAVGEVVEEVSRRALGPVLVVSHSTTQAVNALLEGDTEPVGILGVGRRPDLRRAERRTRVGAVQLAPARFLATRHAFVDATGGASRGAIEAAIDELMRAGARALCVSEAFGVDDPATERLALEVARARGLPACAGHELSGLYGLELRTVTAALNASILPTALRTAALVETSLGPAAGGAPLLVMRGDGGACDIRTMSSQPLLTAFSGPAASVAGALRHIRVRDGIVVEVGGTSTNVSAIRGGRPVLAYVRVLEHVTCVRSLDVRVVGVAGGSLIRLARRLGRMRVADVGPRSAHIAGLPYCCFAPARELARGRARLVAPRPGDPEDYAVVETPEGRRFALTLTCAANALGEVTAGSYAAGDAEAARLGFEALAHTTGGNWATLARSVLNLAAAKVARVVEETAREALDGSSDLVGVGGGAGALVPAVARALGTEVSIPPDAEVISSVGDALSLVRVELEHTVAGGDPGAASALCRRAEEAALASGASPETIRVESEAVPERAAIRAVAVGALALDSGASLEAVEADEEGRRATAEAELGARAELVVDNGFYSVFASAGGVSRSYVIVDRLGAIAGRGRGRVLAGSGSEVEGELQQLLPSMTRHYGPISVAPEVRLLSGPRLVDLTLLSSPEAALSAARAECAGANGHRIVALLSRA